MVIINRIKELDKKEFQEANKLNIRDFIRFNCTKNYVYQEDELLHLPIIINSSITKRNLNYIGINKVGDFIKIYVEDILSWIVSFLG